MHSRKFCHIYLNISDNDLYSQTMPNDKEKKNIITTYCSINDCSKCSIENHYWTEWNSATDLSKPNSKYQNDNETLELHREIDPR